MDEIKTIDDYITAKPAEVRMLLQAIRETIKAAAPEAVEKMSWQMPTFWQGENIVHFAAHSKHISIYPGGEAVGVFAEKLTGYKTSKGAVQFPIDKPIDHALITDIVRWRLEKAKNGKSVFAEPTKRESYVMPDFIAAELDNQNLRERYDSRPPYQRNDYIGWIMRAKREETRQKRLAQMLNELKSGNSYMGMAYKIK